MVYTDKTHLIADSLTELHSFAKKLGLKREWFQFKIPNENGGISFKPHYDLFGSKKQKAIDLGAKLVSSKEIVAICKLRYNFPTTSEEVKKMQELYHDEFLMIDQEIEKGSFKLPEMDFCSYCSNPIFEGNLYCKHCGEINNF